MQFDTQLEFFSHVVSADFDTLAALLAKTKDGRDKQECSLFADRDYQCYYPDHHQYAGLLAQECLKQTGFSAYEDLLDGVCADFSVSGQSVEEKEHALMWHTVGLAAADWTEEDFVRFALELRVQPEAYTFEGIKKAVSAKYAEKEILPMYKIALCVNAMVLGYFAENPCAASKPYVSSLLEVRSAERFAAFSLFGSREFAALSEKARFNAALVLAAAALRKRDLVFYGRSGDSKAELIRKLKRFTALLKSVPSFAYVPNDTERMGLVYAFNAAYLGMYKMPLPREMACEMLFGKLFGALSPEQRQSIEQAETSVLSLEEITKKLLALGVTKDQMQDLIGVLALSNNKLIKIENIFIEWAVKLGLR